VSWNEYRGQEEIMDWMFDNWDTIDHSHPGGVFGHSQGGAATVSAAHDGNSCLHYGLHAAVMMHPFIIQKNKGPPWIASMYVTGTLDLVVNDIPIDIFNRAGANNVDRAFGNYKLYNHFSPCWWNYNKEALDIANWFGCYLYYNRDSCGTIWGSFCNNDKAWQCYLIKGSGQNTQFLAASDRGVQDWNAAIASGDPLKALSVPWGNHNGTFEARMEEIKRRGDWIVAQRRERLEKRWAKMGRNSSTYV